MAKVKARRRLQIPWRYVATAAMFVLLFMSVVFGVQQVEQFLIRDPRFVLTPPAEYGDESPNLKIEGVEYASRPQVLRVFQADIGRSLFLFPLAERRNALRRIPWIKDASIIRTWPNHISVRVTERRPVAFVQLPAEHITRWSLIDSDGVILEPPLRAPFKLPVITGVRPEEALAMRAVRVRRMKRMLDDLGPLRDKVSDVDVADLDDLKLTFKMGDRPLVLMMGDRNFRSRFQNLLDHYEEIQSRISYMAVLDLRLDDRITVLGSKHD